MSSANYLIGQSILVPTVRPHEVIEVGRSLTIDQLTYTPVRYTDGSYDVLKRSATSAYSWARSGLTKPEVASVIGKATSMPTLEHSGSHIMVRFTDENSRDAMVKICIGYTSEHFFDELIDMTALPAG